MPQITLDLPANFMRLAENFKTYYSSKHTSRKLTFNHFHSSAILIANYKHENGKPRSHELQVDRVSTTGDRELNSDSRWRYHSVVFCYYSMTRTK